MGIISKKLTKNYTKVPLFNVILDYSRYKKYGKENSCKAICHPIFRNDKKLEEMFKEIVDYIRDNYNVEEII